MLQVVALDFVPVKPYITTYVGLGIGRLPDCFRCEKIAEELKVSERT